MGKSAIGLKHFSISELLEYAMNVAFINGWNHAAFKENYKNLFAVPYYYSKEDNCLYYDASPVEDRHRIVGTWVLLRDYYFIKNLFGTSMEVSISKTKKHNTVTGVTVPRWLYYFNSVYEQTNEFVFIENYLLSLGIRAKTARVWFSFALLLYIHLV